VSGVWRPAWLAGVVVATLLVAGCSGDEPDAQPRKPSAPSTSPVATTSPSPTPPALPAAARRNSKAGAVAFAHHYIDLINYAAATGATDTLRASSESRCRGCARLIRSIDDIYSHGGWIRTPGWQPQSWTSLGKARDREWEITVSVRMPSEKRKTSDRAPVTRSKPSKGVANFRVEYGPQGWSMAEMGLL
jgi:hypothetical protein